MRLITHVLPYDRQVADWDTKILPSGTSVTLIQDEKSQRYFHFGYMHCDAAKVACDNLNAAYQDAAQYRRDLMSANLVTTIGEVAIVDVTVAEFEERKKHRGY